MAVGLSGNLVDFGIADVFQLIGQQRKTGVLELRNDSLRVQLVFDRGMVVSAAPCVGRPGDLDPLADRLIRCGQLTRERAEEASAACRASAQTISRILVERGWVDERRAREAEELVTRDTIFDVLRWQSGTFDFRAQGVSHGRSPADLLGAEQILMDGLRMVDEWQSFRALVPCEETVFAHGGGFERFLAAQPRSTGEVRACAERVFGLVDGRLSARRIIDLARLGTFDGVRTLAELVQAGAIRPVGSAAVRAVHASLDGSVARGGRAVVHLAAGALPVAVLAAVVWWTGVSSAHSTQPAQRIERSTLESLSRDYAMRALRQALEAYRLDRGRWPDGLEELERVDLLPPGTLAAAEGRPYYSTHRETGPILLSSERP